MNGNQDNGWQMLWQLTKIGTASVTGALAAEHVMLANDVPYEPSRQFAMGTQAAFIAMPILDYGMSFLPDGFFSRYLSISDRWSYALKQGSLWLLQSAITPVLMDAVKSLLPPGEDAESLKLDATYLIGFLASVLLIKEIGSQLMGLTEEQYSKTPYSSTISFTLIKKFLLTILEGSSILAGAKIVTELHGAPSFIEPGYAFAGGIGSAFVTHLVMDGALSAISKCSASREAPASVDAAERLLDSESPYNTATSARAVIGTEISMPAMMGSINSEAVSTVGPFHAVNISNTSDTNEVASAAGPHHAVNISTASNTSFGPMPI
jgi:hypothetical protein